MSDVGGAYVDIKAKPAPGFEADAERSLAGPMAGIAKKAAAIFAGAFVITKAFDFGRDAFGAAAEANKIAAQTQAVIASTGSAAGITAAQVGKLADSIAAKTGVDDEAIVSAQNLLLTFTNIRNGAGEQEKIFDRTTKAAVDMAAALGGDAASQAKLLGKALNDPAEGLSKLTRLGVTFTAAQEEQIKTLAASGKSAEAQGLILDELGKKFGGSAEAQATATDKMKVAIGNAQEAIGGVLVPAVEFAANVVSIVLPQAIEVGTAAIGAVVGAFKRGGDDIASSGFNGAMERVGLIARSVVDGVVEAWPRISRIAQTVAGEVGRIAGGGFDRAKAAAAVVIDFVKLHWPEIKAVILDVAATVREVGAAAFDDARDAVIAANDALEALYQWFQRNEDAAIAAAVGIGILVSGVLALVAANQVADSIEALTASIRLMQLAAGGGGIVLIIVAIAALAAGLVYAYNHFQAFREATYAVDRFMREKFLPTIEAVVDWVSVALPEALDFAASVWDRFGGGITRVVTGVLQVVSSIVSSIVGVIRGLVDVIAGIFTGDWSRVWAGMQQIVSSAIDGVVGYLSGIGNIIVGVFDGIGNVLIVAWELIWRGLKAAGLAVIDEVVEDVRALPGRVLAALGDIGSTLVNAGALLIGGLWQGIKNNDDDLVNFFIRLPLTILEWVGDLGSVGLKLGAALAKGIAAGIDSAAGLIYEAVMGALPSPGQVLDAITPNIVTGGDSDSFFRRFLEGMRPRMAGGPVSAGAPYLVGEGGPELFLPGVSGTIANASQLAAILRGASGRSGPAIIQIDASIIVQGPIYGVEDLNLWADERDRSLAQRLSMPVWR